MSDDLHGQVSQLQTEIAQLEQAIAGLAALPETQRQLEAQRTEKLEMLAALQSQLAAATRIATGAISDSTGVAVGDGASAHTTTGPQTGSVTSTRDTYVATIQNFFGQLPGEAGEALLEHYLRKLIEDTCGLRLRLISEERRSGAGQELLPPIDLADVFTNLTTDGPPLVVETYSGRVAEVRARLAEFDGDALDPATVAPEYVREQVLTVDDQELLKNPALLREQHGLDGLPDDAQVRVDLVRPELALEAIARTPRLVLLGAPGSGKSTVLRYLALLLARHLRDPREPLPPGWDNAPVPILCPLGVIADALAAATPGQDVAVVWQVLEAQLDGGGVREGLGRHLRPALNRGGAILLLDGLDELPAAPGSGGRSPRARASAALHNALKELPRSSSVALTCRVLPYDQAPAMPRDDWRLPPDTWIVRRIQPLAFGQVRQFVTSWYDAACRQPSAIYSVDEGARRAENLIGQLAVSPRLRGLVESPLLLTMLAILHYNREAGELPRDRARLYDECVRLLLDRWEPVRTPELRLPGLLERMEVADIASTDDLRAVMHTVALQGHDRPPSPGDGRGVLRGSELEGELSRFLRRLRCDRLEEKLGAFELALRDQTGLLHALGDDSYAFPHLTFQEFLAACALADSPELTAKTYRLWSSNDGDRWREVILLLMGRLRQQRKVELQGLHWLRALRNERTPDGAVKSSLQRQRDALLAADCYAEWDGRVALTSFEPQEIDQHEQRIAQSLTLVLAREPLASLEERLRAGRYLGQLGDPRIPVTSDEWRVTSGGNSLPLANYWCAVPAGTFLLGSDDTDKQASSSEKPQHRVALPAYRIARYPVTNAQWQQFVAAGGYQEQRWWSEAGWQAKAGEGWTVPRYWNHERFNGANQPIVGVSWYEAVAFCNWLTAQGHKAGWLAADEQIRLPSEAEWEKAARGADGRSYPWDDEWDAAKANTDESGIGTTTPVGCYSDGASPCGALDMSGNVLEWTATPWTSNYSKDDGTKIELSFDERFVWRGGSWADDQQFARCAFRDGIRPALRDNLLGVRLVAALALNE